MKPVIEEPFASAEACIIWMHGLGADASDMQGLASEMTWSQPVRHIFMNAPVRPVTLNNGMRMPAWYDITGVKLTDREDEEGILDSARIIADTIAEQRRQGMAQENIYLAGFSQGGAMALFSGLMEEKALGGIIALSAYIPLNYRIKPLQYHDIPIFLGSGRFDPIVLPQWTQNTVYWLKSKGYTAVSNHQYPMEHAICMEEIRDLQTWLDTLMCRSAA